MHQKANSADHSYQDVEQVNGMAVNVEECEDEFLVLRRIKNAPTTRSQRSPSSEIEDYLCEEPVIRGQKLNPLEYWKVKECQGELRDYASLRRVFCATPTTAAVERIFSVAGFVLVVGASL